MKKHMSLIFSLLIELNKLKYMFKLIENKYCKIFGSLRDPKNMLQTHR